MPFDDVTAYVSAPAVIGIDPASETVALELTPEPELCPPTASVKTGATPE